MSLRRFVVFALLGAGLGYVALSWRSSNGGRDEALPPAPATSPAAPSTVQRVPVELAAEISAPARARETEPDEDEAEIEGAKAEPDRIALLTAAGFSSDRAAQLVRREVELRVAAASDELAATGTVRPLTGAAQRAGAAELRAEIGDDEYERYLEALGLPTRVVVRGIDEASPAANAGLLPGDEIVAYAGQRVFNARELSELSARRSAGETVAARVVRDGQPLQLYVTGGPLGLDPAP